MVTKTVMNPEERRRELLACAMKLFAEEGYDNVSVRAVARAAGVAPGLAYHYFDSKEKMFAEAIEDYARRCAESICELSWGDIDFKRGIIDISHSYDTLGNLKETKTKAGMRLLPLPENVAEALMEHKKAQKERYDRTNQWRKPHEGYIEQTDESPVISDNTDSRVLSSSLSRWWTEDRVKYGLEGWCLHELRHTYLTMLALSGVHPKVMQELTGHYSSQITMDIYTHVNMDAKRDAVAAVSKAFA